MNEEVVGIEVKGEIYPIKDEQTNGKTQILETKVQELELSTNLLKEEIKKVKTGNIYSTDEKICGTWINNKPIYRKVIELNLSTAGGHRVDVASLNIEEFIVFRGIFNDTGNEFIFTVPEYTNSDLNLYISFSKRNQTIYYQGGNIYGIKGKLVIIIEYTKTTD